MKNQKENSEKSSIELPNFQIVLLGEPGVGKTSIIDRFINNIFDKYKSQSTSNIKEVRTDIHLNNKAIKLKIFYGGEQEKQKNFSFLNNSDAIILTYSVDKGAESFRAIKNYHLKNSIENCNNKNCLFSFCLNKIDLKTANYKLVRDGKMFAKSKNFPFFEISAKENIGIEKMFYYITEKLIEIKTAGSIKNIKLYQEEDQKNVIDQNEDMQDKNCLII